MPPRRKATKRKAVTEADAPPPRPNLVMPTPSDFEAKVSTFIQTKLTSLATIEPIIHWHRMPAEKKQALDAMYEGIPRAVQFAKLDHDSDSESGLESSIVKGVVDCANDAQHSYFKRRAWSQESHANHDENSIFVRYSTSHDSFVAVNMEPDECCCNQSMICFQLNQACKRRIVQRYIQDHLLEVDQMLLEARSAIQNEAASGFAQASASSSALSSSSSSSSQ